MDNLAALAERYLKAVERGDKFAHARGLELAEAVLKACEGGEGAIEQGRVEGKRAMLIRQLEVRFGKLPDDVVVDVAAAGVELMEAWAERVVGLVAGWWGRRWSLIEVRDLLGHSSVTVTERYAHLAESALHHAAAKTRGGRGPRVAYDGV